MTNALEVITGIFGSVFLYSAFLVMLYAITLIAYLVQR